MTTHIDKYMELRQKKLDLETAIAQIKVQLEEAKARRRTTGKYADAIWFSKARTALRMKGADLAKVNFELSKLKQVKERNLERCFIECAREMLPSTQFQAILTMAQSQVEDEPLGR